MPKIPNAFQREKTWKDHFRGPQGVSLLGSIIVMLAYGLALIWTPGYHFLGMDMTVVFRLLIVPIPLHSAPFVIIHWWWGVATVHLWFQAAKLNNPWLCTSDGHYSIDDRHGQVTFGDLTLVPLGSLTTTKPGHTFGDQGWAVVMNALTTNCDADKHGKYRLYPVKLSELPPVISQWLRKHNHDDDEDYFFGFPDEYLRPHQRGPATAQEFVMDNQRVNSFIETHAASLEGFTSHADSMATLVKLGKGARRGDGFEPEQPRFVDQAQQPPRRRQRAQEQDDE